MCVKKGECTQVDTSSCGTESGISASGGALLSKRAMAPQVRWSVLRIVLVLSVISTLLFLHQNNEWLGVTSTFYTRTDETAFPPPTTLRRKGVRHIEKGTEEDESESQDDGDIKSALAVDDPEEVDEDDDPSLVAPRSHSGPYDYYDPLQKYILYHPSGGFSNQRREIEYAVEIGKLLNRTVYVPMCGRHTNGWAAYNALKEGEDLFPMDRILDFPFIEKYDHRVRLVPLNTTVSKFIHRLMKQYGEDKVLAISRLKEYYGREQVIKWRQHKHPIIFFRGTGFYHPWFPQATLDAVRTYVRFTKYLRDLAIKVAREAMGEKFYAMHIRMGDYSWRRTKDASSYLTRAKQYHWKYQQHPVYIATEPNRDKDYFAPLDKNMKVVYSDMLPKDAVKKFKSAFPKGKIRNDMLGLLEQLIAAQSTSFIGTFFSTFSAYISFVREHKKALFPELVNVEMTPDGNAGGDNDNDNEFPVSTGNNDSSEDDSS